jgi:phosphatidylglycerophosphate synthase
MAGVRKRCKPAKEDSLYDRAVLRKISPYFTYVFLLTGISPNQITLLSQIVAVAGSLFFLHESPLFWVLGWLVLQLYLLLDDVDGEVARCLKRGSEFGVYFDTITHPFVNALVFATASFGIYRLTNDATVFLFGFLACGSALFFSIHRWYSALIKNENRIKKSGEMVRGRFQSSTTCFGNVIGKIGQLFTGVGGMVHMVLVPAALDSAIYIFGLTGKCAITFRYVFLVAAGVAFPFVLARRIYNFKKLLG